MYKTLIKSNLNPQNKYGKTVYHIFICLNTSKIQKIRRVRIYK